MGVIPIKVIEQLAFFNLHAPVWVSQATNIGLTVPQATAFLGLAGDAQAAWDNQQTQKNKTIAATADMKVASRHASI